MPDYEVCIERNGRVVRKATFPTEAAAVEWGEGIIRDCHRLPNSHRHRYFITVAQVPSQEEKDADKRRRQQDIENAPGPHTARVSYTWSENNTRRTKLVEKKTFSTWREANRWIDEARRQREAAEPTFRWSSSIKPASPHEDKQLQEETRRRIAREESARRAAEHEAWRQSPEGQDTIRRQEAERVRAEQARQLAAEKQRRNERIKTGVAIAAAVAILVALFVNVLSSPQQSRVPTRQVPPRGPEGVTACEQIGSPFRIDPNRDPFDLDHDGDGIACEQ